MKITIVDEGTEREQIVISAAGCSNRYVWLDRDALRWRWETANGSGRTITVFDLCDYYPEVRDYVIRRTIEALEQDLRRTEANWLRVELFAAEHS